MPAPRQHTLPTMKSLICADNTSVVIKIVDTPTFDLPANDGKHHILPFTVNSLTKTVKSLLDDALHLELTI